MFEIKPKNDKTKQSIAFYTLVLTFKKFSLIRSVILVSRNRPKNNQIFGRTSALKDVKSKNIRALYTPNGMISF